MLTDLDQKLFAAVECGNCGAIRAALEAGANIQAYDPIRGTALHIAVKKSLAATKLLVSLKAKVDAKGRDGETPLCAAVSAHKIKIAAFLLDNGADIHFYETERVNVLDYALGDLCTLQFLVAAGASLFPKMASYYSVLVNCINRIEFAEATRYLLRIGAGLGVTLPDTNGLSCMNEPYVLVGNQITPSRSILGREIIICPITRESLGNNLAITNEEELKAAIKNDAKLDFEALNNTCLQRIQMIVDGRQVAMLQNMQQILQQHIDAQSAANQNKSSTCPRGVISTPMNSCFQTIAENFFNASKDALAVKLALLIQVRQNEREGLNRLPIDLIVKIFTIATMSYRRLNEQMFKQSFVENLNTNYVQNMINKFRFLAMIKLPSLKASDAVGLRQAPGNK